MYCRSHLHINVLFTHHMRTLLSESLFLIVIKRFTFTTSEWWCFIACFTGGNRIEFNCIIIVPRFLITWPIDNIYNNSDEVKCNCHKEYYPPGADSLLYLIEEKNSPSSLFINEFKNLFEIKTYISISHGVNEVR